MLFKVTFVFLQKILVTRTGVLGKAQAELNFSTGQSENIDMPFEQNGLELTFPVGAPAKNWDSIYQIIGLQVFF